MSSVRRSIHDPGARRAVAEGAAFGVLLVVFLLALLIAGDYPSSARLFPRFVGTVGAALSLAGLIGCLLRILRGSTDRTAERMTSDIASDTSWLGVLPYLAAIIAFFAGAVLIGFVAASSAFCLAFLLVAARARLASAAAMTVFVVGVTLLLGRALNVSWPSGILL